MATLGSMISGLPIDKVEAGLVRQREENPTSIDLGDAEQLAQSLRASMREVRDRERITSPNLRELSGRVRHQMAPMIAAHQSEIESLEKQLADRGAALRKAEASLQGLKAALELDRRMPEIKSYVKNAKQAARLNLALRPIPNLMRSLTEVSKLASEDLVNSDFQARFKEECQALQTPTVRLEFIGRKGKARRRKSLAPDHRLSKILSEGEQKVLALADFIAEARMGGSSAPVIFDDPVNSLDHRRIKQVADRIASLVSTCQVVVFTHDIWLATELLDRFADRSNECTYYNGVG